MAVDVVMVQKNDGGDSKGQEEEEEGDLPDLATLLRGSRCSRRRGAGVGWGNTDAEPEKRPLALAAALDKKKGAGTRRSRSSTSKRGKGGKDGPSHDFSEKTARSAALPAMPNSHLLLHATPSLQPTRTLYRPPPLPAAHAILDTESTTTTTMMTTTRSSRQVQQRKSPGKGDMPLSPVKRSVVSPTKKGDHGSPESRQSRLKQRQKSGDGDSRYNSRSLKPAHVNSLLLPLSGMSLGLGSSQSQPEAPFARERSVNKPRAVSQEKDSDHTTRRRDAKARGAMFVLKEAVCGDDHDEDEGEDLEDDDDEFSDLSGFIVDDAAEISFHDSGSGSDSEAMHVPKSRVTRKIVRGAPNAAQKPKRDLSDELRSLSLNGSEGRGEKKVDFGADSLADAVTGMDLGEGDRKTEHTWTGGGEVDVIDLTASPVKSQRTRLADDKNMPKRKEALKLVDGAEDPQRQQDPFPLSDSENAANTSKAILRFSPPRRRSPIKIEKMKKPIIPLSETDSNTLPDRAPPNREFTTPPQTPPASPSKLGSPTKLNSPSKRAAQIPQSPHRQSIDAFWSSEVINEWNDQYSPAKPPLTVSPKKKWRIWDDDDDEDGDSGSDSPSESPARRIASPTKGTASPAKKAVVSEKKAAAAAKKRFDETKVGMAHDLLKELDDKVSNSKLAQLSQSTGGVTILWSKNLRSTAGRANWRRTVTKPSSTGSPIKGNPTRVGDIKVQHFASIELAEKVIDSEERLVNTLAHEYCHLANFMVSGVRDQPHGASFKLW
jgi:SprT-like family